MQEIKHPGIRRRLREKLCLLGPYVQKHMGQIGYYACIALVLTAVAMAAERWRSGSESQESLILPAVEITAPAERELEPIFQRPDGMRILRAYSSRPEWNHVHGQWECHTAVDYACADGQVRSFSDGVVQTVGRSGQYGGFVEIGTEDYLLRYASIEPLEELQPGEYIAKGEYLGAAGDNMPGEAYLGDHLHFELIQNGERLDFETEADKKLSTVD